MSWDAGNLWKLRDSLWHSDEQRIQEVLFTEDFDFSDNVTVTDKGPVISVPVLCLLVKSLISFIIFILISKPPWFCYTEIKKDQVNCCTYCLSVQKTFSNTPSGIKGWLGSTGKGPGLDLNGINFGKLWYIKWHVTKSSLLQVQQMFWPLKQIHTDVCIWFYNEKWIHTHTFYRRWNSFSRAVTVQPNITKRNGKH
jgi:hypothetical protein